MLESSVLVFVEAMRRPERQSKGWISHNKAAVASAIDALEAEADTLGDGFDVGTLTVAVALAFVDQTFPEDDWRASHPALARWFEAANARPSMRRTILVPTGKKG